MNLKHDRFQGQNLFKSDQNAELPQAESFSQVMYGLDNWTTPGGKMWDDSEVSDEEMDRLMEQQQFCISCEPEVMPLPQSSRGRIIPQFRRIQPFRPAKRNRFHHG